MKRRVLTAGILAGTLALAGFAGAASAGSAVSTYYFYGCTGPGVPSAFWAVKTELPGSASHGVSAASAFLVVGSNAVYTVYDFGFGAPHGIDVSGVATDWCWVQYSNVAEPVLVGGLYNPGT